MGDTVKLDLTNSWVVISDLTLDSKYGLQNIVNESMYLRQQATIPVDDETGMLLVPFTTAILIKEANDIYIRMKSGNGIAYLNELGQ